MKFSTAEKIVKALLLMDNSKNKEIAEELADYENNMLKEGIVNVLKIEEIEFKTNRSDFMNFNLIDIIAKFNNVSFKVEKDDEKKCYLYGIKSHIHNFELMYFSFSKLIDSLHDDIVKKEKDEMVKALMMFKVEVTFIKELTKLFTGVLTEKDKIIKEKGIEPIQLLSMINEALDVSQEARENMN